MALRSQPSAGGTWQRSLLALLPCLIAVSVAAVFLEDAFPARPCSAPAASPDARPEDRRAPPPAPARARDFFDTWVAVPT